MLAWLLGAAGPAAVAVPVEWTADALAGAAQRWFRRLRRTDDLSRLVRAATGTSVGLTRAEFDAVRLLLEDQQTWDLLGRGTVEDLAARIASCMPAGDGRTAGDSRAAALVIARGLLEFAVADLALRDFQRLLLARLQRMETDQASAARQAASAAEHIRRSVRDDPASAADAAWAAADTLHVAARALRNPELRRAADSYDRAARARYGAVPPRTSQGSQLRQAARLMAMTGPLTGGTMLAAAVLAANLVALAVAVAELREAQQLAGQAAAARAAAGHLHAAIKRTRRAPEADGMRARASQGRGDAPRLAFGDFPGSARPGPPPQAGAPSYPRPAPRGPLPPRRAGPGR